MPTVTEEPVILTAAEERQKAIREFVPPPVEIHRQVFWYALADRGSAPHLALIIQQGLRCHQVRILSNEKLNKCFHTVHHINDPILKEVDDLREGGAWDYTDEDKKRMTESKIVNERLANLARKLEKLESDLGGTEPASKAKK